MERSRDDDLKTVQQNTGKLLLEFSDESEFVFGSLPKDRQEGIMEIEAIGYKIQKKQVGIYVMRVLGNVKESRAAYNRRVHEDNQFDTFKNLMDSSTCTL